MRSGYFPRVTVIGTGYLGLTHAVCMADLGHEVLAIDVDEKKIAKAAAGDAPFFEPGLEPLLRKTLDSGRLRFTTSFADVGAFGDVHFVCVGTPEGEAGQADLSFVYAAADSLAPHLTSECPGPGAGGRARRRPRRAGVEPGVPAGGIRGAGQPGP
jgi:UDPglucose 6-dehydrogenase